MAQTYVSPQQRFRRYGLHCPICNGHSGMKPGHKQRCAGYISTDGDYVYCTREEHAGNLDLDENTEPAAFCHKLYGLCNCGKIHNPERSSSNGHTPQGKKEQQQRNIIEYSYPDEHGRLAYQAVRYDPKDFKQRRPDGKGGWLWNLQGVTRIPYRLPELLKAPQGSTIYICEGEKAVEAARHLGVIATTNVCGAGKWTESCNKYLKGHHVVILPDNDQPGRDHAKKVAEQLAAVAYSVRIIALPDLPEKGDICEWIAAGGTKEKLEELCKPPKRRFTYASEVQEQPIEWLWEGRLAKGELTLGVGDAGLGKGLSIAKLIAHITRGLLLPGGPKLSSGGVILMSPEDSASRTIVPRLRAAGADLSKVLLLTEVDNPDLDTNESYKRPVSFPEDAHILREAIEDAGAVAVFIDPILSMISGKIDVYRNHEVRQALAQVMSTADKHGCAVFGVIHTTKGQHPNALFRSSSSTAFIEMARVALFFVPDPDGEADKSGVIVNHKNNLAERAPSIRYTIHKTADNIGYITWEGMSTHSRDELLNQVAPSGSKSIQEIDLLTILKTNEVAMSIADILKQLENGQTADALEIMLRRKVTQGLIFKPTRGLYTYTGNPLYSAKSTTQNNDVGNVGNVGVSEMSESDSQNAENIPKTDIKPTMSESSNGHKPASEAALQQTDISDTTFDRELPFSAPIPYNDGPKDALEAASLMRQWVDTPYGYGQIVHTASDRVDVDIMGRIHHLRGMQIPQIRVRGQVQA